MKKQKIKKLVDTMRKMIGHSSPAPNRPSHRYAKLTHLWYFERLAAQPMG